LIILGGEIEKLGDYFLHAMKKTINQVFSTPIILQYSVLNFNSCLKGATHMAQNITFAEIADSETFFD
jgi:hypothetical protein